MKTPRKVFVPTREQRNQVCIMVAAKWTPVMICVDLGISPTNLNRHFKDELANGADQVKRRAMHALMQLGLVDKNIAALKSVVALTHAMEKPPETPKAKIKAHATKTETALGKKVKDKIAAEEANKGLFETPAGPPSLKTVQ